MLKKLMLLAVPVLLMASCGVQSQTFSVPSNLDVNFLKNVSKKRDGVSQYFDTTAKENIVIPYDDIYRVSLSEGYVLRLNEQNNIGLFSLYGNKWLINPALSFDRFQNVTTSGGGYTPLIYTMNSNDNSFCYIVDALGNVLYDGIHIANYANVFNYVDGVYVLVRETKLDDERKPTTTVVPYLYKYNADFTELTLVGNYESPSQIKGKDYYLPAGAINLDVLGNDMYMVVNSSASTINFYSSTGILESQLKVPSVQNVFAVGNYILYQKDITLPSLDGMNYTYIQDGQLHSLTTYAYDYVNNQLKTLNFNFVINSCSQIKGNNHYSYEYLSLSVSLIENEVITRNVDLLLDKNLSYEVCLNNASGDYYSYNDKYFYNLNSGNLYNEQGKFLTTFASGYGVNTPVYDVDNQYFVTSNSPYKVVSLNGKIVSPDKIYTRYIAHYKDTVFLMNSDNVVEGINAKTGNTFIASSDSETRNVFANSYVCLKNKYLVVLNGSTDDVIYFPDNENSYDYSTCTINSEEGIYGLIYEDKSSKTETTFTVYKTVVKDVKAATNTENVTSSNVGKTMNGKKLDFVSGKEYLVDKNSSSYFLTLEKSTSGLFTYYGDNEVIIYNDGEEVTPTISDVYSLEAGINYVMKISNKNKSRRLTVYESKAYQFGQGYVSINKLNEEIQTSLSSYSIDFRAQGKNKTTMSGTVNYHCDTESNMNLYSYVSYSSVVDASKIKLFLDVVDNGEVIKSFDVVNNSYVNIGTLSAGDYELVLRINDVNKTLTTSSYIDVNLNRY